MNDYTQLKLHTMSSFILKAGKVIWCIRGVGRGKVYVASHPKSPC